MREVKLSLISTLDPSDTLARALHEFEARAGVRLRLHSVNWAEAWSELVKIAIYRSGPDVSEVGSTWVSDLHRMDAIQTLTRGEIAALGAESTFLPASWESCLDISTGEVCAIPWLVDTRLLYYRRDLLQQAGVDETGAFATPEAMRRTLEALQQHGVESPWVISTKKTHITLHILASNVWSRGGDFLSRDGKRVLFLSPEAMAGFAQYFELARFLSPAARNLEEVRAEQMYVEGRAAVTVSGPWLMRDWALSPEVRANTGIIFPPGVPFVGGSNLVLWNRTSGAFDLARFLSSKEFQSAYLQNARLLPCRTDVLAAPPFSTDSQLLYIGQGLQRGRSFKQLPLWGLVEDRLTGALSMIWQQVLQAPEADPRPILERTLGAIAHPLEMILEGK
jgi:multiple sugar transport system substrate-binding protein